MINLHPAQSALLQHMLRLDYISLPECAIHPAVYSPVIPLQLGRQASQREARRQGVAVCAPGGGGEKRNQGREGAWGGGVRARRSGGGGKEPGTALSTQRRAGRRGSDSQPAGHAAGPGRGGMAGTWRRTAGLGPCRPGINSHRRRRPRSARPYRVAAPPTSHRDARETLRLRRLTHESPESFAHRRPRTDIIRLYRTACISSSKTPHAIQTLSEVSDVSILHMWLAVTVWKREINFRRSLNTRTTGTPDFPPLTGGGGG